MLVLFISSKKFRRIWIIINNSTFSTIVSTSYIFGNVKPIVDVSKLVMSMVPFNFATFTQIIIFTFKAFVPYSFNWVNPTYIADSIMGSNCMLYRLFFLRSIAQFFTQIVLSVHKLNKLRKFW